MRFDFIKEIPWLNYVRTESAHWHLALFGWVFLAMSSFVIHTFLPDEIQMRKRYNIIFWCIQVLIVLGISTILLYGYTFIAMGFDITLCLCIVYFIYIFLRTFKNNESSFSGELIKIALLFLAFSFCGLLLLIPIELIFSTKRSILYYLGTQFFLHFSYNGWFTFGIFALFFRLFENHKIPLNRKKFTRFKRMMAAAVFFTYFLSIYWGYPGHYPFLAIASCAGFLQLAATLYVRTDFLIMFRELKKPRLQNAAPSPPLSTLTKFLFQLAIYSWIIKLFLQAIIVFPQIASMALTLRNYMIAYLHLMFLGVTSCFLIGFAIEQNYIRIRTFSGRIGVLSFVTAFFLTELILVYQGALLWFGIGFFSYYYELLFAATVLLPLGLLLIVLQNFRSPERLIKP